jgi:DNA-binding response OmpR family regulator
MMKTHPAAARTPVVFLTARDLSTDVLEGLNTGAADYITKPFNSDEVVTRCTRLLRPSQSAMRM